MVSELVTGHCALPRLAHLAHPGWVLPTQALPPARHQYSSALSILACIVG